MLKLSLYDAVDYYNLLAITFYCYHIGAKRAIIFTGQEYGNY